MNIENIHDALNLLDDDMLEAVDKLRNEKTQITKLHRKNMWVRWGAVAACLCIVAVSVYVTDGFGLMSFKDADSNSAQIEVESDSTTAENESKEVAGESSPVEVETDTDQITDKSTVEMPSVLVEIVSWQENGFIGTIAGIVDTEKYAVGTTVTVKFEDTASIKVSSENGTQYEEHIPDSTDFPEGSVVCVQFSAGETESNTEIILYAEQISLEETE